MTKDPDHVRTTDEHVFHFAPGYADTIAHVVATWSSLEMAINQTIWEIAGTSPALGACLTAQMVSLNSRLSALLALMKVRGFSDKLVSKVNKFVESSREPLEIRNRIVHDEWVNSPPGEDSNLMGRVEITAPKKLTMDIKPVKLTQLKADLEKIVKTNNKVYEIRNAILTELRTLPDKHKAELHPIYSIPKDP
jgi:hypothetical protein